MNQQILYIGQDEQLAHHLTGILLNKLSESPYIFKNHTEAANWLVSHPDVIDPILLYERQSLQSDIRSIKFLRSMQTQVYILLVTDDYLTLIGCITSRQG